MGLTCQQDRQILEILKEELIPAMGCTEPIAIAYAAARARKLLGTVPRRVRVEVSGNIVKNAKSVVVPHTGGMKGIPAAAAAGIIAGREEKRLEVISEITPEQCGKIAEFLRSCPVEVELSKSPAIFDLTVYLEGESHSAAVQIQDFHTNIVLEQRDGAALYRGSSSTGEKEGLTDRSVLSVEAALDFAQRCPLEEARELVERQIQYNCAIAQEGMLRPWGAEVGRTLRSALGTGAAANARAMAAAGSDARMSGCELPVVIVSGSGNQGITACVPVVEYAHTLRVRREDMVKAVLLSDLLTIHIKTGIGRLSAYCGAVSAGCAAGAAIAYLHGAGREEIEDTLTNSLALLSGMVCDGAKPSCAAKISAAVDAGILGWQMSRSQRRFLGGDGIVGADAEQTIRNVGQLASVGMRETDREILHIMTRPPER